MVGGNRLMQMVLPGFSLKRYQLKHSLYLLAFLLLILALVNPQMGTKKETVTKKSADVVLAVDISRSMRAEDVKPSRLDVSKRFSEQLIEALKNERIGLILFAGNAYLQMPLTNDFMTAQVFVRAINTESAGTQGTSIKDAIDLAVDVSDVREKNHGVMIIISDGEDHEEGVDEAVQQAVTKGMMIITVGVGTEHGGYIPENYGNRRDFLRDESGNPVTTVVNTEMLKDIARAAKGKYFNISERNIVQQIKTEIDKLDKVAMEQRSFSEYESYYTFFLALGTLLIALIYILPDKKL
jgi:Ca-activated chloride channel family protein